MKAKIIRVCDTWFIEDGAGKEFGPYQSKDDAKADWPRIRRNRDRRERHRALTDMGLNRVKGALGGVYYE